ncbi:Uu.00g006130.m01.CDS01 [Anthostomella pinea]|uniref:Uu.00g006130.m01.CDS01 n=1 Tax=Anthostomella pinea TaxID=933095 RepID=A0AAI8YJ34_9PEZI|nr:Uu.00g006130.m01.CDS01 [Anthostomella pinea]
MPDFGFAFVSTDSFGKPKKDHRQLIRSHCVKGKNRRAGSYRSAQYARQDAEASASKLAKTLDVNPTSPSLSALTQGPKGTAGAVPDPYSRKSLLAPDEAVSLLPPLAASSLAFFRFAEDIDHESLRLLSECVPFNIYPIEACLDFNSTGLNRGFAWMAEDAAYLHSSLLTLSALRDYTRRQQPGSLTIFHLRKTLSLLNRKLATKDAHLLDSVISIVMTLNMMAGIFDDSTAAQTHMMGLEQVVRLRGGMKKLNPKIRFKIACLDVAQSASSEGKPRFNDDTQKALQPLFRGIYPAPICYNTRMLSVEGLVDHRMSVMFTDLQHLVTMINQHSDRNTRVNGEMFQSAMDYIQSRLLQMDSTHSADDGLRPLSECLRLGMLAFMITMTFQLPGRRYPYPQLADKLRSAYRAAGAISTGDGRNVLAWVLLIGALSVFDADEEWLCCQWRSGGPSQPLSWDHMREQLVEVMWIGRIHDEPGRKAFETLDAMSLLYSGSNYRAECL